MAALDPDPDPAFSPPPSISTSLLYTRGRYQPSPRPAPPPPPQPQPPLAPRLKHATLHPVAPLVTETSAAYFPEGLARFLIHGGQTHYIPRGGAIGEGDSDEDGEGTVYFDAQETLDRDKDDGGRGWIREDAGELWGGEDTGEVWMGEAYWGGEDPHSWGASAAAATDEWEETMHSPSLADDDHHRRRHHFPRFGIYRSHAVVPRLFNTASDSDYETETGVDRLYC